MVCKLKLFFICDNCLDSTLQSTISYHLFLPRRMLHAEVMDRELSFADKMTLQTTNYNIKIIISQRFCSVPQNLTSVQTKHFMKGKSKDMTTAPAV